VLNRIGVLLGRWRERSHLHTIGYKETAVKADTERANEVSLSIPIGTLGFRKEIRCAGFCQCSLAYRQYRIEVKKDSAHTKLFCSSSGLMPIPVSLMMTLPAPLSSFTALMVILSAEPSQRPFSVRERIRSFSRASFALEINSRRKISLGQCQAAYNHEIWQTYW